MNRQYENLLAHVLEHGVYRPDRTGTGTRSVFGAQMRFDLSEGRIPLITTKKVSLKGIITELLWFLRGDTNIEYLTDRNVTIWNEWADSDGNLGKVYGHQWRRFNGYYDQILKVIEGIKKDPYGRRHLVTAWNPTDLEDQALPPCHVMFQFYVSPDNKLSCHLYQRSCDAFLGVPYNIVSYSILTRLIARTCGFQPGEFVWTGGDVHIYENHLDQVRQQLGREVYEFPMLWINSEIKRIDDYDFSDFELVGYKHHPAIPAPVAV